MNGTNMVSLIQISVHMVALEHFEVFIQRFLTHPF